jgi:hypothetical protein
MARRTQGQFMKAARLRKLTVHDPKTGMSQEYGEQEAAKIGVYVAPNGRELRVDQVIWTETRLQKLADFGWGIVGVPRTQSGAYAATQAIRWLAERGRYRRQQNKSDPRAMERADRKGARAERATAVWWQGLSADDRCGFRVDYPDIDWPPEPSPPTPRR